MAHDDKYRQARSDYIYRRMAASTIAVARGISEATISRWKKNAKGQGDDWDLARSAHIMAGEGIETVVSAVLEDFMLQAQATLEEIKSGDLTTKDKVSCLVALADAMTKMTASAGKLAPRISELGVAQDVLNHFVSFVQENFPHHAAAVLEIIEPFGERLAELYAK